MGAGAALSGLRRASSIGCVDRFCFMARGIPGNGRCRNRPFPDLSICPQQRVGLDPESGTLCAGISIQTRPAHGNQRKSKADRFPFWNHRNTVLGCVHAVGRIGSPVQLPLPKLSLKVIIKTESYIFVTKVIFYYGQRFGQHLHN